MRTIIIENCRNDNIMLTNYISSKFPSLSKNMLFKALRNKDIKVDGKRLSREYNCTKR